MGIIKRLPVHVANKISAGEVVQRPASVVKELIENSLDAGATRISIVIKDAGKTLIQIVDNGSGMIHEDALSSFERFATSKIKHVEDLEVLHTFGFRGEALASISAVAHVELRTRSAEESIGTLVEINDVFQQNAPKISRIQYEQGTSISVRNLFFNVPARRKFLKTDQTEFKRIYEIVKAFSLLHRDIQWVFIVDERELLNFDGINEDNFINRIEFFLGKNMAASVVPISETNDFLTVSGFLGKPAMSKRTKNDQLLFVNSRLIESNSLSFAIVQGYGDLLGDREYPFFMLNFKLNPKKIDVNVHPSKMEVKFEDERNIFNMVKAIISRFVRGMDFAPSVVLEKKLERGVSANNVPDYGMNLHNRFSSNAQNWNHDDKRLRFYDRGERSFGTTQELLREFRNFTENETERLDLPSDVGLKGENLDLEKQLSDTNKVYFSSEEKPITHLDRLVWQVHLKYILTQIKSGLMVIDQHVAHERILYEKALRMMKAQLPHSQQLLFPLRLELFPWEMEILNEIEKHIVFLGFSVRKFGKNVVVIEGVPPDVRTGKEEIILREVIEQYQEYKHRDILSVQDAVAKSYACRGSIMSGDRLSHSEMNSLIDQLFSTEMPYVCPHGRSIIIKLSVAELDKMFGRT